jgi:hypothetical protein
MPDTAPHGAAKSSTVHDVLNLGYAPVYRAPRRIPQGEYKAPLCKGRALRATPCTSPLVQGIGMSKQLLLARVSVDRVGQRTTEHNRSSSPPDSRRLTEYNGVAKAKGWKISSPRNRVGKFRFWQRIARWTRENTAGCAQRRHGIGATRRHLQELQQKVGVLDLGDQDPTNRQTRPRPGARPRGRAGLVRH